MHVHGLGLAHETRQALRAADACDDAKVDLGLTELGRVRRDDEVACHGQFTSSAEGVAGDGCNDRLAALQDGFGLGRIKILRQGLHECPVRHFLDVRAGSERPFRTCQDDAAHLVVCRCFVERPRKLSEQLQAQRVHHVRAVQANGRDVVFRLDGDRFKGHVIGPSRFGHVKP